MNIILLGANGFVGKNIASIFNNAKIPFIPISRIEGVDLRDKQQTIDSFKKSKPDIIINCAAHVGSLNYVTIQAADVISDNIKMILNLYEAINVVNKDCLIINPIANCAYPAVDEKFEEDDLWKGPVHPSVLSYGGAKRLLLLVAKSFEMQFNITTINLIVPNMYGPFDSSDPNKAHALNALISRFVKANESKNFEIKLWGTGVAIREWLYAEDFGRIILHIIQNSQIIGLSEPVNIGQNFGLSIKELVKLIQNHFPNQFSITWDFSMPDGVPKKVMSDTKFKKIFNDFEFTNLNEGIKKTIKYYKDCYPY
jgi:GDP-L-fucose synthase